MQEGSTVRLHDYVDITNAADVEALESLLVRFANQQGFGIISGLLVVEGAGRKVDTFPLGNTPPAFATTFADSEIGKRDPVMRRLKRFSTPFIYDQSTYVKEEAADLWETQASFGYKTGIAMALHLPQRMHFLLGVDRDEPLPTDEYVLTRLMADLQLLAVHAQEVAVRLLVPQTAGLMHMPDLTDRELEVLKWTAEGKSRWVIGQILNISEHTVKYHFNKILTKLEAGSALQAVAKARLLNLID